MIWAKSTSLLINRSDTPPQAKIAELEGFGTRCENLKDVDEHVQPDENASEASVLAIDRR